MDARAIVADLVGKPFKDGARGPESFDCWGLAMVAMLRFGYQLPDFHIAAFESAQINAEIGNQRETWQEIAIPEPGCIIVMRLGCQNFVNHVATYIGDGLMLHTREKTASVIERVGSPVFQALINGYFLPPEKYRI